MNKEWRKIDGYDCEVSSVGNVRRMARQTTWQKARVMKQHLRKGYYFVTLCQNGKTKMFNVHKLVCVAFNGPPVNSDMQVNHFDGNKLNNHYSNLEWVTSSENRKHAFRTGLQVTNLPKPKLDELQVQIIKELAGHGVNQRKIAAYFNICQQTVSDINRGKRWGKLTIKNLTPSFAL